MQRHPALLRSGPCLPVLDAALQESRTSPIRGWSWVSTRGYSRAHMSETLDRVLAAPAISPRPRALGFCDAESGLRLSPTTPLPCFGDGLHLDSTGDGRAMWEGTARFSPLDVAGDVNRIVHGDPSHRCWHIHSGTGLPTMPLFANILDQVVPDANLVSADDLG